MVEDNDFNKTGFKPRFVSEFSMGQFDFERYNKWLEWTERWSAEINSTANPSLEMIQHYFSGLNVLWKNWKAIVSSKNLIDEVNKKIEEAKKEKRVWENSAKNNSPISTIRINKIVDILDSIHSKLMDLKQVIGLGIVVKRNFTTKEKIRAGMGRGNNEFIRGLPEK